MMRAICIGEWPPASTGSWPETVFQLTHASFDLLHSLRHDAIWDDPDSSFGELAMFDGDLTPEQRGNFTDLKVKGLLTHLCEDSDGFRTYNWYRIDMTSALATPTPNQEGA